jgi:uncharacterized protein YegL
MIARRGKINIWAAGFSAAAHLVLLGGFAAVRLGASAEPVSTSLGAVSMQTVKRTLSAPLVTPKPEVKPEIKPEIQTPSQSEPVVVPQEKPITPVLPVAAQPSIPAVPVPETAPETFDAEFFGQDAVARTLCFVVDCSGSMYGRLELIERQLKDCIASLRDTQSFDLILFMDGNTLLEMGDGKAVPASGFAKARAFAMIDNIRLKGQTNAGQAIERAMKIRDAIGRPVELIYFMTDGFDLQMDSSQAFCDEIAHTRRKFAPSVTINTIGLWVSMEDQRTLNKIAQITGGQYISVEGISDNL